MRTGSLLPVTRATRGLVRRQEGGPAGEGFLEAIQQLLMCFVCFVELVVLGPVRPGGMLAWLSSHLLEQKVNSTGTQLALSPSLSTLSLLSVLSCFPFFLSVNLFSCCMCCGLRVAPFLSAFLVAFFGVLPRPIGPAALPGVPGTPKTVLLPTLCLPQRHCIFHE